MEVLSEVDSVGAALGRQAVDTENRKTELELPHAPEKIAAANNLLFKEQRDARDGAQALYSSAQLSA